MTTHHNTSPPVAFDVSAELVAAVAGYDVEPLTSEVGWRCLHCDGRLRASHSDSEEWVQHIVLAELVEAAHSHWCRWPNTGLDNVQPDHIRGWLEAQEQRGVTGGARRVDIYALRSLYDWHHRYTPTANNPARNVHPPRQPGVRIDTYSTTQADQILAHAALGTSTHDKFSHARIATLRYTGLRNNELVSLRTSDIDPAGSQLYVRDGKGNNARTMRIPPVLVRIRTQDLNEVRPLLPESQYLFANLYSQANGCHIGQVAPRAVHHIVNRLGNASGVPGDHVPHGWRHHDATSLIRAGVSLEHVRKLMGHANITTTARYIHLDNHDLATAVNNTFPDPNDNDHLT